MCWLAHTFSHVPHAKAGLFPVAQSSEMYTLTPAERLACARTVKKAAAGRAPVLASGTFPGTTEEQAVRSPLSVKVKASFSELDSSADLDSFERVCLESTC